MGGGGRCGDSQILFLLYSINVHKIAGIIFYRKEGKGSAYEGGKVDVCLGGKAKERTVNHP